MATNRYTALLQNLYWHEIRHIQNHDFYGNMSVEEMEAVNKH